MHMLPVQQTKFKYVISEDVCVRPLGAVFVELDHVQTNTSK
jgi:hypothetical protein